MNKIIKSLFITIICLTLFGCGKSKNNIPKFNFSTGFPTSSLVDNVPEPEFGDSSYYDYHDGSIYITVKNVEEENAKNYIASLKENGWNIDLGENNTELNFSAYNDKEEYIEVSFLDGKMEIKVDGNE